MSVSPLGSRSPTQASPSILGSFASGGDLSTPQKNAFSQYFNQFAANTPISRRLLIEASPVGLSDSQTKTPARSLNPQALEETCLQSRELEAPTPSCFKRESRPDVLNFFAADVQDLGSSLKSIDPDVLSTPLKRLESAPEVVSTDRGYKVYHTQDPKEHKKLSEIANLWAETARARFMNSRDVLTPLGRATPEDVGDDLSQMQDYINVVGYFTSKAGGWDKRHVLALLDRSNNVQGLAKLTEKPDQLYLNALLTAAWNLPQKGETPTKIREQIPQSKGCGTALVASACKLGRDLGLSRLETSPSARARSFYTGPLEMPYNSQSETCVLDISKESLPKKIGEFLDVPIVSSVHFNIPPSAMQSDND